MEKRNVVFIAGAGGIGSAVGLLLRELGELSVDLYLGDLYIESAEKAKYWVLEGSTKPGKVATVAMPAEGSSPDLDAILDGCDIILDCLPGSQAPRIAAMALRHGLHYANLTEYVKETQEVMEIAKQAETGFILQTGLAPGFIGVLAHGLFLRFCKRFGVNKVDYISMKVGALTRNAQPPHYYGFTWSPVGVATEYVKPAIVLREGKKTTRPSLSEREKVIIGGINYEADLTSGGAADLPDALAGKVRDLDYKTLRYPGHYGWVDSLLHDIPDDRGRPALLQEKMQAAIPLMENDVVVIHAFVRGRDRDGRFRLKEQAYHISPLNINGKTLRAIQSTTAAPMAECANMLLTGSLKGPIFQSQLNPETFLRGPYVSKVYG